MDGTGTGQGDFQIVEGQDNPPEAPEGTPEAADKGTPTLTQEEADAQVHAALTKAGRDAKSLETSRAEIKAREDRIKAEEEEHARWRKERDEAELAAVEDDPDKVSAIQLRQEARRLKIEVESAKRENERKGADIADREKHLQETQREVDIFNIATKYNLDAADLKDLGLPAEATEKVAKVMAGKTKTETPPFKPLEKGKSTSGTGKLTDKDRLNMTTEQVAEHPDTKARYK